MQHKKLSEWKHLAEKELRGKKLESLNVETAEGIDIKPLYTETDIEGPVSYTHLTLPTKEGV